MKPDRDGHGFRAHVRNFRPHFEYTVLEAVSDIDGVSERKLFHPSRLFEEFQPACQPGRILIRFGLDYAPSIGCGKKTMNRIRIRSEEHTSELQSRLHLVCRLLLEKKKSTSVLSPSRMSSILKTGSPKIV